jgi:anthranilate synthase/indole-3-glycerol phosphate synthase/phosphoribosylanthranilate isomerase
VLTRVKDVEFFANGGVHAVLVGETLMRANDPKAKLKELRGDYEPLVKICGLTDVNEALDTARSGADLIGLIFAPQSKRKVSVEVATQIVAAIKQLRADQSGDVPKLVTPKEASREALVDTWFSWLASATREHRPLVVGVFADQPLDEVNAIALAAGVDIIQLSGGEDWALIPTLSKPVLRAVHVAPTGDALTAETLPLPSCPVGLLLDAVDPSSPHLRGGTGQQIAWGRAAPLARAMPLALAGGLSAINVSAAVRTFRPRLVDVASGVELSPGKKDLTLVQQFVSNAKHAFV